MLNIRNILRPLSKVGLVVAGYVIAFSATVAILAIYVTLTGGPDRRNYGAMYAFGDSLLFLGVFGVATVPPTGAALYFLRPCRPFWLVLSIGALLSTLTGIAALIEFITARTPNPHAGVDSWLTLAVLRILVAPLLALALLLTGCFAPYRSSRIIFFISTAIEATIFACYLIILCKIFRFH